MSIILLQAISLKAGVSKSTVIDVFNAIAQGAGDPISKINAISLGINGASDDLKKPDGLIEAFSQVRKTIKDAGIAGNTMGQQMGISIGSSAQLGLVSGQTWLVVKQAADLATASMQSFEDVIQPLLSSADKFKLDWEKLMSILTTKVGMPVLDDIDLAIQDITKAITNPGWASFTKLFSDLFLGGSPSSSTTNGGGNGATGGALGKLGGLFNTSSAKNTPSQNSTSTSSTNVNMSILNNISGGGGSNIGVDMAKELYKLFVGEL